ncbi:hypothetical protein L1887_35892 [Cichorium endivia]|nr:hypothetical protein L1887_35892 [Cichorium endivia]
MFIEVFIADKQAKGVIPTRKVCGQANQAHAAIKAEVRKQSGAMAEAFGKHEKDEATEKWRAALKEAASLAGWELKTTADGRIWVYQSLLYYCKSQKNQQLCLEVRVSTLAKVDTIVLDTN